MTRAKDHIHAQMGRFARRREDRRRQEATLQEQRAWWHTAWSRAAAAAKKLRRKISVRDERTAALSTRLGIPVERVRRKNGPDTYGTPQWIHQHAGHPYTPYRNPDRAARLARSGRLRKDA